MRRLKVPGRIIGRKHHYNFDFADPNTDLPLGMAQPAKFTKAFGWLREVTRLEQLTNLLELKEQAPSQDDDDMDVDGRDRAGMLVQPPIANEDGIRKALLHKLLENPCSSCADYCISQHKCKYSHLPREYWQSYGGAGVVGQNRIN